MNPGTLILFIFVLVIAHDNITRDKPEKHPDIIHVLTPEDDEEILFCGELSEEELAKLDYLEEDLNCCPIFEAPVDDIDPDFTITLSLTDTDTYCRCPRHRPLWKY